MDMLLLSVIFVAIATAAFTLLWHLTEPDTTRRRLSEVMGGADAAPTPRQSVITDAPSRLARRVRSFVPKSPQNMNHIQRMLASAGYHSEWAAIAFATVQLAVPVLIFVLVVGTFGFGSPVLFGGIAAALSYYLPVFWLGSKIDARRREIRNGLPDATDLLIVCLEAGSGIDQALARVADELQIAYPSLARELELIGSETRAGKQRMEAFKNFAERTKVDDVRSLVAMLVQTDRFGTSLGMALRTHADTSRTKRRQRAEEKAAKLGVKLLFPLVFCLFPAFFAVVLGPSMVQIYRQFVLELGQK
ncbi:MAG TPA: type II secretion system F family protein [Vicinamibacterales bacterium]|nr:type II secretion system F family protein [Vicinamibacterales bacterium]